MKARRKNLVDSNRKAVWGWVMYDWANSAFATTVMAGFFPIFFRQYWSYGVDSNITTAQLGFGNSIASFLVAFMAPVLGAIADKGRARKKFLIFFAYLGVLMTAALFTVGKGRWELAIFVYILGIIGFSGANAFSDALLPGVSREDNVDYISGLGYAMGYLGGGVLFLINVVMTLKPHLFGLADAAEAVRYSFVSVGLWWGVFTLFLVFWVKEDAQIHSSEGGKVIFDGFRQLAGTFQKIRHLKTVMLFLLAYWLYIDGVHTIIRMAVDYGMSIGFDANDLIVALLITQFVGFPSALIFGKLGQKWDVRKSIYVGIWGYVGITIWGLMMTRKYEFYVLAIAIGLVQGGVQALSRSYYSRFIPEKKAAEYFGFYNMLGKFAAILGPALMGIVGLTVRKMLMPDSPTAEQIAHAGQLASRWSIGSILILFVGGIVLFSFVDEEKGKADVAYLK